MNACTIDGVLVRLAFFFFSSRRRHTRCSRDWSSDVCSSDLVVQISYVGSAGHKLFRTRDINQATPADPATRTAAQRDATRPFNATFPQFSFIDTLEPSANSNYNAFETFLRQRMRKGLTLYVAD